MKGQNNFWQKNSFLTCSWTFLRSNKLEKLEFKLEKLLGFRNMHEKFKNYGLWYLGLIFAFSFSYNLLAVTFAARYRTGKRATKSALILHFSTFVTGTIQTPKKSQWGQKHLRRMCEVLGNKLMISRYFFQFFKETKKSLL